MSVNTLDIGLIAAFVLVMIFIAGVGKLQVLIAVTLVAFFLYPRILYGEVSTDGFFIGISYSHAVLLSCHIAIAFAFVYGIVRGTGMELNNIVPILPLAIFTVVSYLFVWPHSTALSAGLLHLLTICASWIAGSILCNAVHRSAKGEVVLSKWIAGLASFIAIVCILQSGGVDLYGNSAKLLRSFAGARVVATFNEPTAAGKMLFLLAIIAVVWLFGKDVKKRRHATITVAAIVLVALLTQTRTNFAAIGALILLYSLTVKSRNRFSRMALGFCAALLVVFGSYSTWDARFAEGGGIRVHTLEVALDYISSNQDLLWQGVGPNRYFEVLAPLDSWVARGYPAHNYFLFLLVEMGLVGTLLYVLPLAWLTSKSIQHSKNSAGSAMAKAWVCALPGLLLIAMLGWGLLSVVAPALFLVMGYVYASLNLQAGSDSSTFGMGPSHSFASH